MRGDISYEHLGFSKMLHELIGNLAEEEFFYDGRLRTFSIESPRTGSAELEAKSSKIDRFQLVLDNQPGQQISWWIIFNDASPQIPPDFIFHEEDFDPYYADIPSLTGWHHADRKALVKVIRDLLDRFLDYQIESLPTAMKTSLMRCRNAPWVSKDHFSLTINRDLNTVTFFSRIEVPDRGRGLFADVQFRKSFGNVERFATEVKLSESLTKLIGRIPPNQDPSLPEATNRIIKEIKDKLEAADRQLILRKELFTSLLMLSSDSLLEVDVERFLCMSLLLSHDDVYVQMNIELPPGDLYKDPLKLRALDVYKQLEGASYSMELRLEAGDKNKVVSQIFEAIDEMTMTVAKSYL